MRRRKAEHVALQELVEWNASELERLDHDVSFVVTGAHLTEQQLRDLESVFRAAGELEPWKESILDSLRGE